MSYQVSIEVGDKLVKAKVSFFQRELNDYEIISVDGKTDSESKDAMYYYIGASASAHSRFVAEACRQVEAEDDDA